MLVSHQLSGQALEHSEPQLEEISLDRAIPLRVAFDPHLPPFQYKKENKYTGFNIDILEEVARNEGLTLQYLPMSTEQAIRSLREGRIDIILGISFSASLYEDMEFTERYFSSSIGLLVAKDLHQIENISDLSGKIVSLQRGTVEYEFLRNIRRIKYNHTSNQENAFELLTLGRSDAFIGNRLTAEYLLEKHGVKDGYIFADSYVLPLEYSMAVQKRNYALLFVLNRSLKHLKVEGTYSDIYDQWFPIDDSVLRQRLEKTIQVFVVILAVGLLFLFLEIRWNRQLQKEVDRKTRDLKEVNRSLEHQVQQTKNSDQFKEQILESSPRGIVTCNQQGVITSINPKALNIAGLEDKPIKVSFVDVPMIGQLFKGKMDTVLRDGTQYISEERTSIRADGEACYVRFNVYPLFDFEKKIIGTILSFEDVTEERKVREQLFEQEKSRALSQLVAGVAHEIRNPLTSIKTFVELIPRKLNNLKFQNEILAHVPKEIERLNHLIEGLIDYAKPTSVHMETIEINQLIQSCIILFHRSVQNMGFNIQAHVEEELFLEVDPNQLKQVIINLILNGLEAMEEKSLPVSANEGLLTPPLILTIKGWEEDQSIYIVVEDQGIGMTKEEIRRSVDPFYTSKAKGTGLGLALSKQFIQENDGSLHIESRKYEGTKITIRFREKELNHGKTINY